jgi:hypothetical protein
MQREILAANPSSLIRIGGVNSSDAASGNALMTAGRRLPWLQDATGAVWTSWDVTNRDLVILDAANAKAAVYNLTVHDLSDPANYAELLAILRATAGE